MKKIFYPLNFFYIHQRINTVLLFELVIWQPHLNIIFKKYIIQNYNILYIYFLNKKFNWCHGQLKIVHAIKIQYCTEFSSTKHWVYANEIAHSATIRLINQQHPVNLHILSEGIPWHVFSKPLRFRDVCYTQAWTYREKITYRFLNCVYTSISFILLFCYINGKILR